MLGLLRFCVHASLVGVGLVLSGAAVQAAIVAPYSNGFTVDEPFTEAVAANTSWTLNTAGSGTYTNAITANSTSAASTVSVTNLGGSAATATGFVMSSKFTITANSGTGANNTIGFAALSTDPNPGTNWLLADIGANGVGAAMRLLLFPASSNTSVATNTASVPALNVGTEYTMTLSGTYSATGDLSLVFSLLSGTTTLSTLNGFVASSTVNANLTGNNFGLRNRSNAGAFTVAYNDFSINTVAAIPEPGTWAAGVASLAGVLLWRRRRAA